MRIKLIFAIIFIVVLFCACSKQESNLDLLDEESTTSEYDNIEKYPPNEDPVPLSEHFFSDIQFHPGIDNETKYDNIKVEIEYNTYKMGVDEIRCKVTNENPGKAFRMYRIPCVEYYNEGQWVRLRYYTQAMRLGLEDWNWYYCYEEDNVTEPYSTYCRLYPEYIIDELIPGKYRMIVYVGPNKYYEEFELTD